MRAGDAQVIRSYEGARRARPAGHIRHERRRREATFTDHYGAENTKLDLFKTKACPNAERLARLFSGAGRLRMGSRA